MRKKLSFCLAIITALTCLTGIAAFGATNAQKYTLDLNLDGQKLEAVSIITQGEATYIELDKTAKQLGWQINEDTEKQELQLSKNNDKIIIPTIIKTEEDAKKEQVIARKNEFGVRLGTGTKLFNNTRYIEMKKLMDLMELKASISGKNLSIQTPTKPDIRRFSNLGDAQQVIIVSAPAHDQTLVMVQTFEKTEAGTWRYLKETNGVIGRAGFGDSKKEGDGRSPVGIFTLGTAFGTVENPGTKLPYIVTNEDDIWVDDAASKYYNTWQKKSQVDASLYNSKEDLMIDAYKYAFVIDYNTKKVVPGDGSAIFFHVKGASSTAGCTAVSEADAQSILKWLDPAKKPIVIQGSYDEIMALPAAK